MSSYLGFQPTKSTDYCFVSYNNEDAERVGHIAELMAATGINLWYDHGIDYGADWETVITERIRNAQAIVLFFSKGILQKSNSYVQKEYKIATEFFDKKVFVVLMDRIDKEDVPVDKIAFWMSVTQKQCITGYEYDNPALLARDVIAALRGEDKAVAAAVKPKPKRRTHRGLRAVLIALLVTALLLVGLIAAAILSLPALLNTLAPDWREAVAAWFAGADDTDTEPETTEDVWQESEPNEQTTGDIIYIPGWSDDPTDTKPQNGDETEPQEEPTYSVTAQSNIQSEYDDAGYAVTVQPAQDRFKQGDTVTLSVTIPEGYNFAGWYQNDTQVSTDPTYALTVQTQDVYVEARFTCYTVTTSTGYDAAYSEYGSYTVLQNKKVSVGTQVTLTATPANGYNFEGWYYYGSDTLFSREATCTFTMEARDVHLEPRFSYYTLTTSGYDYEGMAGSYPAYENTKISVGTQVTLTATVKNGYTFEGWYRGDVCVSEGLTYAFTMQERDVYVEARFACYTLSVTANDYEGTAGTVSNYKDKIVAAGEEITLEATVNEGYNFEGWYIRDVCVSSDTSFTYVMKHESVYVEARYSCYTVTTGGYDYEGMAGSYTKYQNHRVSIGKQVTLTATANAGYAFGGWYVNGICVSESPTYTFAMPDRDVCIEVLFNQVY
jgi:hypothetical protein